MFQVVYRLRFVIFVLVGFLIFTCPVKSSAVTVDFSGYAVSGDAATPIEGTEDGILQDDDEVSIVEGFGVGSLENPIPVQVVPVEEDPYEDFSPSSASDGTVSFAVPDSPPDSPPFYGVRYISGTDSRLGSVTIYFPSDTPTDSFSVDSSGRLVYVASGTLNGYLAGVYNNRVAFTTFDGGTYRVSGSGYDSIDLSLIPTASNLPLSDAFPPVSVDITPYILVLIGGVLLLWFSRR